MRGVISGWDRWNWIGSPGGVRSRAPDSAISTLNTHRDVTCTGSDHGANLTNSSHEEPPALTDICWQVMIHLHHEDNVNSKLISK